MFTYYRKKRDQFRKWNFTRKRWKQRINQFKHTKKEIQKILPGV